MNKKIFNRLFNVFIIIAALFLVLFYAQNHEIIETSNISSDNLPISENTEPEDELVIENSVDTQSSVDLEEDLTKDYYIVRKKYVLWPAMRANYDNPKFMEQYANSKEAYDTYKNVLNYPFVKDEAKDEEEYEYLDVDLIDDGDCYLISDSTAVHLALFAAFNEVEEIVNNFNDSEVSKSLAYYGILSANLSDDRKILSFEVNPDTFEEKTDNEAMNLLLLLTAELASAQEYLDAYNRVDIEERTTDDIYCLIKSGYQTFKISAQDLADGLLTDPDVVVEVENAE